MSVLAYLTARIDFPEDEIEERDVSKPLMEAKRDLEQLIATADAGIIHRQGVRTAIVGRPNVGKSSLLNYLLGENRAIVTSIPGTTRDTIEEVVNLGGVPFVLVDTAGIVRSKNVLESMGVERSRRAMEQAALVLLVIDASELLTEEDRELMALAAGKAVLAVANKCDLPQRAKIEELPWEIVFTSALMGEGLAELRKKMVSTALGGRVFSSDTLLVTNPRHKSILEMAKEHLIHAIESLESNMPDDFITIDLTAALNALGEITGETVHEDLLETIFSQFCVGK
jgi:tRNA modification GTPase